MDWFGGDFDQDISEFAERYREPLIDHLAAGADSVLGSRDHREP